jgi:hypothetical protein
MGFKSIQPGPFAARSLREIDEYYGTMDLSGNLWERSVTVSNSTGRAFEGAYHGNGALTDVSGNYGNANVSTWPGTNATGAGFRGGNWNNDAPRARLSDRNSAADIYATRFNSYGMGGRGVRTAPLWNPSVLSTALWLDAADSSTITTVSGAVSQWSDKSGNNRHLSQGNASLRPTWSATGLNGKGALNFDGTDDFLQNTDYNLGASAFNYFGVWNPDFAAGGLGSVFLSANGTVASEITLINGNAGYKNIILRGNTGINGSVFQTRGSDVASLNGPKIVSAGWDGAAQDLANYFMRNNGADLTMADGGLTGYTNGENGISVGRRPLQVIAPYKGSISEFLVFTSDLSLANRQLIEGYLAWKWGLAANLPASHPYYRNPPP